MKARGQREKEFISGARDTQENIRKSGSIGRQKQRNAAKETSKGHKARDSRKRASERRKRGPLLGGYRGRERRSSREQPSRPSTVSNSIRQVHKRQKALKHSKNT
ncbi:hypothetical protein NPIL_213211 [Nephila pilipes]|uniref:Uncharacterized protein n=1 Tax=Nephila pilipes TaxID=299642 RepID=A0A8X6QLY8_NEPPI|nr:hypothetical protein NPIL_213211 [Nephila pilipes]